MAFQDEITEAFFNLLDAGLYYAVIVTRIGNL